MRQIRTVAFDLTTVCNRSCTECCAAINMGKRPAAHHDMTYIERAAAELHGIERLHVTGGEPLTHPHFDEIAPRLRGLFGCQELTIQTNAFQVEKHAEALKHFDHVYPSNYGDNAAQVQFIKENVPAVTEWPLGEAGFTARSTRGSGKPCFRGESDTVAYAGGKLYGCCVAPGVDGAQGIDVTPDWRERVALAPLPCGDCWFSE
jgi:hypothetical protein